jgi:hypothetical protein
MPSRLVAASGDDNCDRAKQSVKRYLEIGDFKEAEAKHLIYEVNKEGGTDFSLVSAAPTVTGCEAKGSDVTVLVAAKVYAETSWGGHDGQFPKLQKVFRPPQNQVRRMLMHLDAGIWKIDLWDTDPPYEALSSAVAGYEARLKRCETDKKERELCSQSVGADLETLREFAKAP